MAFVAALIALAGPASAQQDDCIGLKGTDGAATECVPGAGKSDRPSDAVTGSLPAGKTDRGGARLLVTELIGQTVHASDGSEAGRIVDVVVAPTLDGLQLVIRIGGIMGVGGRDIAVPASQILVAKDSSGLIRVAVAATPEQLQRAPVFDRTALMR